MRCDVFTGFYGIWDPLGNIEEVALVDVYSVAVEGEGIVSVLLSRSRWPRQPSHLPTRPIVQSTRG